MRPDFLCIGAQKSGTTTLWHILDAHPEICMAQPRETKFFYHDFLFSEGLAKYELQHFSHYKEEKRVGEKCPEYLYVPKVAERIHQSLGSETRFIVTLRSPAQRAFAHYRHNMVQLREQRSFAQALEEESAAMEFVHPPFGYLGRGFYAKQIQEYFKYFSRDQFLFIHFEKEIANQKELAKKIYHFLGVPDFIPSGIPFQSGSPKLDQLKILNKKNRIEISHGEKVADLSRFFFRRFRKSAAIKIASPSEELIAFCKNFNENKPSSKYLTKEEELQLNLRFFQNEINWLSDNINSDFRTWLP